MNPIINIGMFIIGFAIGLFVNSQIFLPLIYGLPKSIWYFFKGRLRFMSIPAQFFSPIIWYGGLTILTLIFEIINPAINHFLYEDTAFGGGWTLSFFAVLFSFFTVSGRVSMKTDYDQTTYDKYKK